MLRKRRRSNVCASLLKPENDRTIYKKDDECFKFKKGDIIFINKKDIYYWQGTFKLAIVCNPAWNKNQCKLFDE